MTDTDPKAAIEGLKKALATFMDEPHGTSSTVEIMHAINDGIDTLEHLATENERYREALEKITQQPVIAGGLLMQKIATAALTSPSQPDQPEATANPTHPARNPVR